MKNKVSFIYRLFSFTKIPVMVLRNQGQAMVGIFLRLIPAIGGTSSKSKVYNVKSMLKSINRIALDQGLPGLVKYLKTCCILLQQYLGGHQIKDLSSVGPRVSRTKSGLPRLLPSSVRYSIRKGSQFWVRMSLSILSLFRALKYPGKLKTSTITAPYTGTEEMLKEIIAFIPRFLQVFVKNPGRHLLGPMKIAPISKSSPNTKWLDEKNPLNEVMSTSTSPLSVLLSLRSLSSDQIRDIKILTFLDDKVGARIRALINSTSYHLVDQGTVVLGGEIKEMNSFPKRTGKLGLKEEAAGKIRVFAMVDPLTQFVMSPLHTGIFKLLRRFPYIDGTFNQLAPLKRAWGFRSLFSMDLSSATDRLPIRIQRPLIQGLFNLSLEESRAWENLLIGRAYFLGKTPLHYAVGQPMGALSSWAMLALTHHLIVQFSAWRVKVVRPGQMFKAYAVLGDDIVIYHPKVAKSYHYVLTQLGVECNLAKSIISPKGLALEFAKKTFWKGENVSPIPLLELYTALQSPVALSQFAKDHNLSLGQAMKVAGFGYKVLGGLQRPLDKQNLKVQYYIMCSWFKDPALLLQSLKTLLPWASALHMSAIVFEFLTWHLANLKTKIKNMKEEASRASAWAPVSYFGASSPFKSGLPKLEIEPQQLGTDLFFLYETIYGGYRKKLIRLLKDCTLSVRNLSNLSMKIADSYLPGVEISEDCVHDPNELVRILTGFMHILIRSAELEVKMSSLTISQLQAASTRPVRTSNPRMFKLHSVFLSQLGSMSKLSKDLGSKIFLVPKVSSDKMMESSILPIPRHLLIRLWKPALIKRVIIRGIISRVKWLSGWTILISSMTYLFGMAETFTCLAGIWGLLSTLICGPVTVTGFWSDVWFYSCNILLHTFELFLATLIVANILKWNITYTVLDILYQNYDRGFTSLYDSLRIFINYQNNIILDIARGSVSDAVTYVTQTIPDLSFYSQIGIGMIGTWIFTWFVKWFFGI